MIVVTNIVLLTMLALSAWAIAIQKDLFAAVMMTGLYSLLAAVLFVTLDAVDVAFTEAAVGAGISTILMLGTLAKTSTSKSRSKSRRALGSLVAVIITGSVLIYGTFDMPKFGDPNAPSNTHVARHYLEKSDEEIGVPNVVTSVLASYRGYDTLGEVIVIFTAGLGVLTLLGRGTVVRKKG